MRSTLFRHKPDRQSQTPTDQNRAPSILYSNIDFLTLFSTFHFNPPHATHHETPSAKFTTRNHHIRISTTTIIQNFNLAHFMVTEKQPPHPFCFTTDNYTTYTCGNSVRLHLHEQFRNSLFFFTTALQLTPSHTTSFNSASLCFESK